jgi:hypothetical protein
MNSLNCLVRTVQDDKKNVFGELTNTVTGGWLLYSFISDSLFLTPFFFFFSPGVPPSANAHVLFRGFSFIAPCLLEEQTNNQPTERQTDPQAKVNSQRDR